MANNIAFLGSIIGPEGAEGPEGPRGRDGVNGVENDTAVAGYVDSTDSETAAAVLRRLDLSARGRDVYAQMNVKRGV